jgi:hypothetical protein
MANFDLNLATNALNAKGVLSAACTQCSTNAGHQVLPGFAPQTLEAASTTSLNLEGSPFITTVAVVCNNCGFIRRFAAPTLGLT